MPKHLWLAKKPDTVGDWLGIIAASVLFYLICQNMGYYLGSARVLLGYLSPFAGGVVLAYVLNPIVHAAQKHLFKRDPKMRWAAILVAYLVAGLVVSVLVWLVVPQVIESLTRLFNNIPAYAASMQAFITGFEEHFGVELQLAERIVASWQDLMNNAADILTRLTPEVMGYLGNVASNVVAVFTALASSIYMLADKHKLLRQLRTMTHAFLPPHVAENVLRICHEANANFSGFFIGKLIDSLIIGLLTFVAMLVLRLDFAPLISVFVGITNIIPVFGPFIGAVPGIIILLFADPLQAAIFLVLIIVIQQLDGNFIGPKILGQSIGISALWVLFSIVLGGNLLGIVGMVLGVPVFATLYGVIKEFTQWCLDRRGIDADGKPLPEVPENIDEWTIRN